MTFSDGVAVAAIALSLFTILLGVLFYRWQTEQGARTTDTIHSFAKDVLVVLAEIKGLTVGKAETRRLAGDVADLKVSRSPSVPDAASAEDVRAASVTREHPQIVSLFRELPTRSGEDTARLIYKYGEVFGTALRIGLIEIELHPDYVGLRLTDAGRQLCG